MALDQWDALQWALERLNRPSNYDHDDDCKCGRCDMEREQQAEDDRQIHREELEG